MRDKNVKPIIVDADETFEQHVDRLKRQIHEETERIAADVELKTRMVVDKHNEEWAETLKRLGR